MHKAAAPCLPTHSAFPNGHTVQCLLNVFMQHTLCQAYACISSIFCHGLLLQVDPSKRDISIVSAAAAELQQRLTQLEQLLRTVVPCKQDQSQPGIADTKPSTPRYAVGQSLTLADCGYPAAFLWVSCCKQPPFVSAFVWRLIVLLYSRLHLYAALCSICMCGIA